MMEEYPDKLVSLQLFFRSARDSQFGKELSAGLILHLRMFLAHNDLIIFLCFLYRELDEWILLLYITGAIS